MGLIHLVAILVLNASWVRELNVARWPPIGDEVHLVGHDYPKSHTIPSVHTFLAWGAPSGNQTLTPGTVNDMLYSLRETNNRPTKLRDS